MSDLPPSIVWVIPLYLVFCAAVCLLVTDMKAKLGGWSELARHYRDPEEPPRGGFVVLAGSTVSLRRERMPLPMSYPRCVTLTVSGTGLHLRVLFALRFRHPPLLIPWTQVERVEPGTAPFFRLLTVHPRGTDTHIHLSGRAAAAVAEAWERRAAGSAQPAPA